MNILVSHPTGNANVRAAIAGIEKGGNLLEFHTAISADPNSWWIKSMPSSIRAELLRRQFNVSKELIHSHPFKELGRLGLPKLGLKTFVEHEVGRFSVDKVYQNLDKTVARRIAKLKGSGLDAVYAYEDGAHDSFLMAKKVGVPAFYDLPIGYWRASRRYLEAERIKNPDWAATLTGFKDSQGKLDRKDQELKLADQIFVASTFTKKTLEDFPGTLGPIHVIPYGFPNPVEEKDYRPVHGRKLKLLFVGGLSQRKGIAYLFEALRGLKESIELTVVGRKPIDDCQALNSALESVNWIPSLNHSQVLDLMKEQDVFVFPSLFEGFGLVITEAMSQGVPVITTDRTCGPDVIADRENGWIIEPGSAEAITEVVEEILNKPELIEKFGKAARQKAISRPWTIYGEELNDRLESLL